MDQPAAGRAAEVLRPFLGRWRGFTEIASSPWGPARTAEAEVAFTAVAGGHAVVQSYHHRDSDGAHLEGHGMFTVDASHGGTFWYYVDSIGQTPPAPVRGHWSAGTLSFERRTHDGTVRHSFKLEGGVLVHTADLRLEGKPAFSPLLRSVFRKN